MNSPDFKHFKFPSRSTLQTWNKKDLIDYIYLLIDNMQIIDEKYCSSYEICKMFDKALENACIVISSLVENNEYKITENGLTVTKKLLMDYLEWRDHFLNEVKNGREDS